MMEGNGLRPEDIGREDMARALDRDSRIRRNAKRRQRDENLRRANSAWGYRVPGKRMKRERGE